MNTTAPNPAYREVALPLAPLLTAIGVAGVVVAAGWVIAVFALKLAPPALTAGLAGCAVVAASSTATLLLIQPWSPKPLYRWPMVWIGASFLRLAVTLGMAFLLYSATPFRDRTLWFAVVASYLATQVGETRTYATLMKRIAPAGAPPSASE